MKKTALIAILAASSAAPAFAGEAYVVGSAGRSSFDINQSRLDDILTSAGAAALSSSLKKTDTAYKVQLGYEFNKNVAIEGGYVDLGKAKYSATFTGGNATFDAKASGVNIAVLGIAPVNESFSIFGKLGVIVAKVDASAYAVGNNASAWATASSTKAAATWGVGATLNINKQFAVRAEYEQFSKLGDTNTTGQATVDLASVGLVLKF